MAFATYLAIMLPGKATLTVYARPPAASNTAVGFEVSRSALEGSNAGFFRFMDVTELFSSLFKLLFQVIGPSLWHD